MAHLCYADPTHATTRHKWHVHASAPRPDAVGGFNCSSAGGHFDPTGKEQATSPYTCDRATPQECFLGDMSGKLGLVNISGRVAGRDTTIENAHQFSGLSIVIHAEEGAGRIACAPLQPVSGQISDPCSSHTPSPPPPPAARPPPPAGGGGSRPPPPPPSSNPTGGGGGKPPTCGQACNVDCPTCINVQNAIKNPHDPKRAALWSLVSQCTVKTIAGDATASVTQQQQCLTEMAQFGMLQPLLKMLSCCVRDANSANDCENGPDNKGCVLSTGAKKKFPVVTDSTKDRYGATNTCEQMFLDEHAKKIHTCGQSSSVLANPAELEDGTAHGISCIAKMNWRHGSTDRAMQLGLPCDARKDKICFGGQPQSKCNYAVMKCLLQSDVFSNMTSDCSTESFPNETPPTVSFPSDEVKSSSSCCSCYCSSPPHTHTHLDFDPSGDDVRACLTVMILYGVFAADRL